MLLLFSVMLIIFCVFCDRAQANVSLSVQQYQSDMQRPDKRVFTEIYIDGLLEGFVLMNVEVKLHDFRPIFCQPSRLGITTAQAMDILDRYLRAHKSKPTDQVEYYLLNGLEETFPCNPP